MKTKQLVSLIIAAVILVFVGITGVITGVLGNIGNKAVATVGGAPKQSYVGILKVEGTMTYSTTPNTTSPFTAPATYDHQLLIKAVRDMAEDKNNKGILLFVNSPGGEVMAADDLYLELMDYKEATGRPIYAYFDSLACSGGYYVSMASDEIYANRQCTTGSIGVYATIYEVSKLFEKYGVREVLIKSGENKGMGSIGQELTDEQIAIEQVLIDEMYDNFITLVANGRGMDKERVRVIADGRAYSANQALELGLIDGISRYEEYKEKVRGYFPEKVVFYEMDTTETSIYSLLSAFSDVKPKSEEELFMQMMEKNQNRGGIYYESIYR